MPARLAASSLPAPSGSPIGVPRPLVFLHGFMGRGADWEDVASRLAAGPAYALDLPGHGRSLALADAAYTLAGAADAVVATLDALGPGTRGLDAPVLVGYSLGGRVALTVALRHPGRVRALVLESASPGLRTEAERAARLALDADRATRLEADFPAFLDGWYRMPLFASLAADPARLNATVARRRRGDPPELARALRGLSVGHQPSYWARLGDLPPTLALAGALDPKYAATVEAMAEAAPVTAHVVPDAGHNVHLERPDAFAYAVRSWLAAEAPA